MGFCHIITLALAIICLFVHSGQGAPTKGRYVYFKCKPDGKNANCVTHKGPLVTLLGQSARLPPSAAKKIFPVSTEETTPESEELSGEGSGSSDTFPPFPNMDQLLMRDEPEQEVNKNEEEASTWMESSGEADYSEYIQPQKI